jgi:hypothetical protein
MSIRRFQFAAHLPRSVTVSVVLFRTFDFVVLITVGTVCTSREVRTLTTSGLFLSSSF